MRFKKGKSGNPKGKPIGTKSKFTVSAKRAFEIAFDELGGEKNLAFWAKKNQTEFYRLYARLIPEERKIGLNSDENKIESIEVHIINSRDQLEKLRRYENKN
jgi:hypothetical protein